MKKLLMSLFFVGFVSAQAEVDRIELYNKTFSLSEKHCEQDIKKVSKLAKKYAQLVKDHLDPQGVDFVRLFCELSVDMPFVFGENFTQLAIDVTGEEEFEKRCELLGERFSDAVIYQPSDDFDPYMIMAGSLIELDFEGYDEDPYTGEVVSKMFIPLLEELQNDYSLRLMGKEGNYKGVEKPFEMGIQVQIHHFMTALYLKFLMDKDLHKALLDSAALKECSQVLSQDEKEFLLQDVKELVDFLKLGFDKECRTQRLNIRKCREYRYSDVQLEAAKELELVEKDATYVYYGDLTDEQDSALYSLTQKKEREKQIATIGEENCSLALKFFEMEKKLKAKSELHKEIKVSSKFLESVRYGIKEIFLTFAQELK